MKTTRREELHRRGRAAALWCAGIFVLAQVALLGSIETFRPSWADPEYGYRLYRLQKARALHPNRRLVLFFGSSHVGNGFDTDYLAPPADDPQAPLYFNMSLVGSGPSLQLITLRRVIAAGLKPDEVVFEGFYPLLYWDAKNLPVTTVTYRMRLTDLGVYGRHDPDRRLYRMAQWVSFNCAPWYTNRFTLVGRYAPFLPTGPSHLYRTLLSPTGHIPIKMETVPKEVRDPALKLTRDSYRDVLQFKEVHACTDALWREIFQVCAEHDVKVVGIVAMPEETVMQGWYRPETRALCRAYLTEMARQYGTHFIDASNWVPDSEFVDGHHLILPGARRFTRRFIDRVYLPQRRGEDLPTVIE